MCNRYSLHSPLARLQEELALAEGLKAFEPTWNVAPTDEMIAVRAASGRRIGRVVRWGMRGPKGPLCNARSETATTKRAFAEGMRSGRCLVPADGFYEWRVEGTLRQPYFVTPDDGSLFAFGGLLVETPEGPRAVVLTTDANEAMREVHDRMPLVVPPEAQDAWLDDALAPEEALAQVPVPFPAARTRLKRVSTKVNSVRNDGPELLEPPQQGSLF